MGYNLYIGNGKTINEDGVVSIEVEEKRLENAPAFGEPTDYTNQRWPSYSGWRICCKELGIEDIVYGEPDGYFLFDNRVFKSLIARHPHVTPLEEGHYEALKERIEKYKSKNPNKKVGYGQNEDGNLVRAEWMLFWIRWALDNCENPVFKNL